MHGRPRKAPKPEEAAASVAKAAKLRDLQNQLIRNRENRIYTKDALLASSKLLEINPEGYTGWNYRKLALEHNLREVTDPEVVRSAVEDELRVVEMALRQNPKSYGAWYHRKWVLSQKLSPVQFEREFRLLDQLLKADARNFHGWNYRRFIAKMKNVPEEEELQFTMDMINTNFSNYSAWHNRSILLSHLLKQKVKGFDSKENVLLEEFELVRQALFTDPSDQSGWFYHLWLLDQTSTGNDPQLISSWPVNGSKIDLSKAKREDACNLFASSSSSPCDHLQRGYLPIILYFNQPVRGLTSSTVTVNSNMATNEDLTWKPLSTTNSREANCWVAYLEVSDGNCSTSQAYSVEVSIGSSDGIMSTSGSQYSSPSQLTFTIGFNHNRLEQVEGDIVHRLFSWNYSDKCYPRKIPDSVSFDHMRITNDDGKDDCTWRLDTLSGEIALFKEMSEENCKFMKLTLARLLVAYDSMNSFGTSLKQNRTYCEEALELFDDLIKLDPSHKRYYEDERSLLLMDQVTSNKESLEKRCWHYDNLIFFGFQYHNCLQLSRLSLTRIGFVERLLWVQMLDLSHNNLRSISGLEALQLLVCLNLSNNQIGSFTALEPLKMLISLRVLDLSFNEIGAHPTDTTRYLSSSPLSHTVVDVSGIIKECKKDNINVEEYWEAILFFKPLHLAQLSIKGNIIANENYRVLLTKILPTLNWFDGERIV
ncbi:geranylgeranyl transferase type-2 subunit alpha 1 isoform X1 [Typha latifolia]|uniref:geranylgeranyl transferase type-2 subunit alpha 1 isoform X1 n=2 Tax=Typha latifolia TaxID=4733 RepID=UPI003C2F29DF